MARWHYFDIDTIKEIVKRYDEGESVTALSKVFKCTPESMKRTLKGEGIRLRGRSEAGLLVRNRSEYALQPKYLPTPEEIATEAAKIKRQNLQHKRLKRLVNGASSSSSSKGPGITVCDLHARGRRRGYDVSSHS